MFIPSKISFIGAFRQFNRNDLGEAVKISRYPYIPYDSDSSDFNLQSLNHAHVCRMVRPTRGGTWGFASDLITDLCLFIVFIII